MHKNRQGFAVFGGTFDPVHNGHLRSAVEVRDALDIDTVKLIPSDVPPHRDVPGASSAQRLDMLRLATEGVDYLEVDDREIRRQGTSFTIDTLRSIRAEIGNQSPLIMVIGSDAFQLLETWREWQSLTDLAHLAILSRPDLNPAGSGDGMVDENLSEELANFCHGKLVDRPLCLHSKPGGLICRLRLTQLDISSTRLREMFAAGESPDYLMPREVISYVRENGLYGATSN